MDSTGAATALAAVAAAGVFEGVALFLSAADPVPSYNDPSQDAKELLRGWRRMFPEAKAFQIKVIALGTAAAATTAWGLRDGSPRAAAAFGLAAAANVAIVAHTMRNMMPLNNHLMAAGEAEKEGDASIAAKLQQARTGLGRWGRLHSLRTALGAVALGASLYGAHSLLTSK
ncbi:hypothetical protein CHLNCDRAFT_144574 [Chlorella variabilis]|uniref:DUF1772 domain-containing protein n=1 Tax=Chlorella variabilis TaxID=554065 RepID=E1ZBQ7_CHLVA|nr:hypothetical protein CHLNCDRAFT_144574 [Chlorella variabilis]EFN56684.1 hypothetical protein CHLNCDRAFT_144574 [Chlorella variabilis]|eukprot:XP_005848786.1 hypothetical protein CHLNCDRAFT_144574 [Chlorella variabilis]